MKVANCSCLAFQTASALVDDKAANGQSRIALCQFLNLFQQKINRMVLSGNAQGETLTEKQIRKLFKDKKKIVACLESTKTDTQGRINLEKLRSELAAIRVKCSRVETSGN